MHPVCGIPMVGHVVDILEQIQVNRKVVIVGHGAEAVKSYLGDRAEYVLVKAGRNGYLLEISGL